MEKVQWDGYWPNDQYPPDGTMIRYAHKGDVKTGRIKRVWCGIEPTFDMDNGDHVFPSFDAYAVIEEQPR